MAMSDKEVESLAHPEYWDDRYARSDGQGPTHEWFRTYSDLQPFFARHLFDQYRAATDPTILHLGAGDSTIPRELLGLGYRRQICVDFSSTLVRLMEAQDWGEGVRWLCVDVRDMPAVAAGSVDVAFDKGTLDAMIHGSPWDPPDDVRDNAGRYMREVARALKDDGVFLYITYRQPHFVKPLLNGDELWDLTMETLQGSENSFEYYAFILRKARNG